MVSIFSELAALHAADREKAAARQAAIDALMARESSDDYTAREWNADWRPLVERVLGKQATSLLDGGTFGFLEAIDGREKRGTIGGALGHRGIGISSVANTSRSRSRAG